MTKRMIIILCASLSFMFLFISIGFASLTTDLNIKVNVEYQMPSGLFITNIEPIESTRTNVEHESASYLTYTTTVDCTIDKKDDTTTSSGGGWFPPWGGGGTTTTTYAGSITYEITVYNNTKYEYAYRGLYYQSSLSGYNGNGSVITTGSNESRIKVTTDFPNGKIVAPGESLVFTATYTVGKSMDDGTDWKTLLNYQFGINVETEAEAINAIHEKFLNILNTNTTYEELVDKIDDKYDGSNEWTSNYMGNVSDAVDADSMTVETLFAGQLNMVINGQTKPATVLIKHENIDNNTSTGDDYSVVNNSGQTITYRGCEMTLYLTTDPLTTPNGRAPVYVTVFSCDRDDDGNLSKWYQLGDSYVGTAPIVGYSGGSGGTGSFVTDHWTSNTAVYSPISRYNYTVNADLGIKAIITAKDDKAVVEFQRLLNESKEMIDDLRYAGTGITIVEDTYYNARRLYTLDASGNPVANSGLTRAQIIPLMRSLDYALTEARKAIEDIQ